MNLSLLFRQLKNADEILSAYGEEVEALTVTPTRLKTTKELHARRLAYELDLPWYPDHNHQRITGQVFGQHTSQGAT